MSDTPEVLTEVEDGVLIVTINRPEAKNAMTKAASEAIAAAMDRLDAEARRLGFVPATPADIDYVVIPEYPTEPVQERVNQEPVEVTIDRPESMWEAIALTIRDMGIDLTRGEASEP